MLVVVVVHKIENYHERFQSELPNHQIDETNWLALATG